MGYNFPINPQIGDEVRVGWSRFRYDGRWRREVVSIEEIKQETSDEITTTLTNEITTSVSNDISTALTNTVDAITGSAPENLDTIAELATAIQKTTIVDKTASFTLASGNINQLINCNGTITITLPADDTIPVGSEIAFCRTGTGVVQFAVSGVTLNSSESKIRIKNQYGTCAVVKTGATTWLLTGSLE